MELEKSFIKYYKRICLSPTKEQITSRIEGINVAKKDYDNSDEIMELLKIYYKLSLTKEEKDKFVDCFYSIDQTFDEQNEEEICILAGCVLANMLYGDNGALIAYFIKVLEQFFDGPIEELSGFANDAIINFTKEQVPDGQVDIYNLENDLEEKIAQEGNFTEEAPEIIVESMERIRVNFNKSINYIKNLQKENIKCQEKIQVLSWIMGESSDLIRKPLTEIKDIEGVLILGMELADLVEAPGPFSAEAFLHKMLTKCEKTVEEITLTDLVDNQTEALQKMANEKYGKNAADNILPIFTAIKLSLDVDEKKAWLSAFRKIYRIDPDEIKFSVDIWLRLVYFECMIAKLI